MTRKANSLQAVLDRQAHGKVADDPTSSAAPVRPEATRADSPTIRAEDEGVAQRRFHRPSREGRRLIAGHFDPKIAKQLKLLAAEEDTTVQALLEEALNLLFVKKGKSTLDRL